MFLDVSTAISSLHSSYTYNFHPMYRFALLPLFLDPCKDVYHSCSHCKADLGVYRQYKEVQEITN